MIGVVFRFMDNARFFFFFFFFFLAIAVKNLLMELFRTKRSVSSVLFLLRQSIDLFLVVFMLIIDFIPSQVLGIILLCSKLTKIN